MNSEGTSQDGAVRPGWVDAGDTVETLDAIEMIEAGGHPLPQVMSALGALKPGQIYEIVTPFVPAPMIDKARDAGYDGWTEQLEPGRFKTYFTPIQS